MTAPALPTRHPPLRLVTATCVWIVLVTLPAIGVAEEPGTSVESPLTSLSTASSLLSTSGVSVPAACTEKSAVPAESSATDTGAPCETGDDDATSERPAAAPIETVRWTVRSDATPVQIAESWGMRTSRLMRLNDGLERDTLVAAGTSLRVFQHDADHPTRSMERPTNGTLRNGIPLPEGTHWVSPSHRYQYGSTVTVSALLDVFAAYGEAYPDGQAIRVGDLSRRRGGEIGRKHQSHKSGRDADLGYVGLEEQEVDGWVVVTPETLDIEKTWFLIDALLATGQVQVMFVDKELQRVLDEYVSDRYTKAELAMLFEYPRREHSHRAIIQHWDHHADHIHVRFVCERGNWRCRGRGKWGE